MKKVLFINSWYPSRISPRNGNFIQKHAEASALYNDVYSLHAVADVQLKTRYEFEFRQSGNAKELVVYFRKSENPLLTFVTRMVYGFLAYLKGYNEIKRTWGQPHIVHLNVIFPAGLLAYYLRKKYGILYVITENWTGYLKPNEKSNRSKFRRVLTNIIGNAASENIPVSEDLSAAMKIHGINLPSVVIPNVVSVELFSSDKRVSPHHPFTFLHISTLNDDHKNISGILKAVSLLAEKRKDFCIQILGDGDSAPHAYTALQLGVSEFVKFGGPLTVTEVADAMRNSDCFVLFSNYENLPCVMVEAMASGMPVIATNVGGVAEHLRKEFGELIEAKDIPALVSSMEKVIINYSNYNSQEIRNYATGKFSYEAVGKAFTAEYEKVLKNS
jgi:glycosyltransferase involved in cell wall biosynthesis